MENLSDTFNEIAPEKNELELKKTEARPLEEVNIQDFKTAFYLGLRKLDEMTQENAKGSFSEESDLDFE